MYILKQNNNFRRGDASMSDKIVFGAKAVLFTIVLWLIFIYGYGDFFLADNVVPEKGIEISEWMDSFYFAGALSAVVGLICAVIWYIFGINYAGGAGIVSKYRILLIVSIILGLVIAFLLILPAVDGSGLSLFFAWLISPLVFYINSLFNSAEAVKFIPPLGITLHNR